MTPLTRKLLFAGLLLLTQAAWSDPIQKGGSLPHLQGIDIRGHKIDTKDAESAPPAPQLLVVLFFQIGAGEEMANKIRAIDEHFGRGLIQCMAVGVDENPESLLVFTERMGISYPVIPEKNLQGAAWLDDLHTLPLTVIAENHGNQLIESVISGSGTAQSGLITQVAEQLFQQRRAEAVEVINLALENGEPTAAAQELKGFCHTDAGDFEKAEAAFTLANSDTGKAALALAGGDLQAVQEITRDATLPFARTLLAEALLLQEKTEEAISLLNDTPQLEESDWKQARAHNLRGRIAQANKDYAGAIQQFEFAATLAPHNPMLQGNLSVALQERGATGDLERAAGILRKAISKGDDPLAEQLLHELEIKLESDSDALRVSEIHAQIDLLSERYESLAARGMPSAVAPWSTPPLRLALLEEHTSDAIFPRAGYNLLLIRELQRQLIQSGNIDVVMREVMKPLLEELQLDSQRLKTAPAQHALGETLAASHFAFLDYVLAGGERRIYLRLVDTRTSEIVFQASSHVNLKEPLSCVPALVQALGQEFVQTRPIQGKILEVLKNDEVRVDLGARHGLRLERVLTAYEGPNGDENQHRTTVSELRPIARLQAMEIEELTSRCRITKLRDGAALDRTILVSTAP